MPGVPSLTTFSVLSPPWSLVALDANMTNISTLLKSANNYSLYLGDSGAANAYAVSFGAGITVSLAVGLTVSFKPANANTAASTLNVNGTGAKSIKLMDGSDPAAGDIPTTGICTVYYDGTNYVLISVNPAKFARLTGATFTGAVTISSGALTVSGGTITTGNSTSLSLATTGGTQLKVIDIASVVNWAAIQGSSAGGLGIGYGAAGSDTDIPTLLYSKGAGRVSLLTGGAALEQVRILHSAGANRFVTLTGSNGGAPIIGTSAGNLSLAANSGVVSNVGYYEANSVAALPGANGRGSMGGDAAQGGHLIGQGSSNDITLFNKNGSAALVVPTGTLNVSIGGTLSKGGGAFVATHPLRKGWKLRHSFVEGPRFDLIYRGRFKIVRGKAVANVDRDSTDGKGMTPGTFEALTRAPCAWTSRPDCRADIKGATVKIAGPEGASGWWFVMAERRDKFIMDGAGGMADASGHMILEFKEKGAKRGIGRK